MDFWKLAQRTELASSTPPWITTPRQTESTSPMFAATVTTYSPTVVTIAGARPTRSTNATEPESEALIKLRRLFQRHQLQRANRIQNQRANLAESDRVSSLCAALEPTPTPASDVREVFEENESPESKEPEDENPRVCLGEGMPHLPEPFLLHAPQENGTPLESTSGTASGSVELRVPPIAEDGAQPIPNLQDEEFPCLSTPIPFPSPVVPPPHPEPPKVARETVKSDEGKDEEDESEIVENDDNEEDEVVQRDEEEEIAVIREDKEKIEIVSVEEDEREVVSEEEESEIVERDDKEENEIVSLEEDEGEIVERDDEDENEIVSVNGEEREIVKAGREEESEVVSEEEKSETVLKDGQDESELVEKDDGEREIIQRDEEEEIAVVREDEEETEELEDTKEWWWQSTAEPDASDSIPFPTPPLSERDVGRTRGGYLGPGARGRELTRKRDDEGAAFENEELLVGCPGPPNRIW